MVIILRSTLRHAIAAAGLACALLVSSPAAAQPYRLVSLDTSLRVFDINTDLVAVGSAGGTGVPFIVRDNQPRLFPEAGFLSSATVTDGGLITGARALSDRSSRVFRVRSGGEDLREIETGGPGSLFQTFTDLLGVSNGGTLLITSGVLVRGARIIGSQILWDGTTQVPLNTRYDVPPTATIVDFGADDLIGGYFDDRPFLQRPGEPAFRPWSGIGLVLRIGPGGHVYGKSIDQPVLRGPDGIVRPIPQLGDRLFVSSVGVAGELVGNDWNPTTSRFEAVIVRDGRVENLNDLVTIPGEYLELATKVTAGGAILARALNVNEQIGSIHNVLLLPTLLAPSGVQFAVSGGVVSLSWQPSRGATEYIVEAGTASGLTNVFNGSVGRATSISGSVPAGRYFARVRARDAFGTLSAPSTEVVIDVR